MFKAFRQDTKGNVAGIAGIAALLLVGGIGATLDITGSANLRSSYQNMADAAVLAAARSRVKEESAMANIAELTVRELDTSGTNPVVTTTLSDDKRYLMVRLDGEHDNKVRAIFGEDTTDVAAMAETVIEITEHTEIVLVLDTTGSMGPIPGVAGTRMDSLKTATNTFIDIITDIETDDKVRMAVVPYGQYVNVGTSQRGQQWLDVPADWVETFPTKCEMKPGPVTGRVCTPSTTPPRPAQPG
ncbi:MAG: pilus assembly protein TadG-related protein, partial [Litorimonas sp.]